MLKAIIRNGIWAAVIAALLFGFMCDKPILLNLVAGYIWVMLVARWLVIGLVSLITGCVSGGMDDQSIRAYDSLTKAVAHVRKRSKLLNTISIGQMFATAFSISLVGWTFTAVLYCATSIVLRLTYNHAISKLDDIDSAKAG